MIKDVIIPKVESVRPEFNLMKCLKNWFVGLMLLVADKDGNVVGHVSEKELDAGTIDWQKVAVQRWPFSPKSRANEHFDLLRSPSFFRHAPLR
jgi:hypothetical protein